MPSWFYVEGVDFEGVGIEGRGIIKMVDLVGIEGGEHPGHPISLQQIPQQPNTQEAQDHYNPIRTTITQSIPTAG
ncbi:hypothetical protein GLOIN_2v1778799 [Rhizophagus irregularis DAOM 181602=DAOM 197198]|nr:hypothetical protein GLOIN_2v1778799 [Rhizophagus irregularis DAOM 181602=DAOM 197198]